MGVTCVTYTSSSSYNVRGDVKYIYYMAVGGGGGGARPSAGYGRAPTAGGNTCAPGGYGGGGAAGCLNSGGTGGYGNYSYGQNGYVNYSNGEYARANSGYGPYGFGGAGQWRSPSFTGGGGGGGATYFYQCRGWYGAVPNNSYYLTIGTGGQQGGNGYRRFGNHGAVYAWSYNYDQPTVSISVSPTTITESSGQSATLSWSAGGDVEQVSIDQIGSVATSGSTSVRPSQNTRYTITASNAVYSRTAYIDLVVYKTPTCTLTVTPASMTIGNSAVLDWTSSDAYSASIDNGIGNVNISGGGYSISPTVDTTYTLTVTGNGGSNSDTATITVVSIPTLFIVTPPSVSYGDDITIEVSGTNADPNGNGVTLVITQVDENQGPGAVMSSISIPNTKGDSFSSIYTISGSTLPYDTKGPASLQLKFNVDGYGSLFKEESRSVDIVIDMMPDNIDIPSTEDKLSGEAPVITPDVEVTSEQIVINDIDIPVEIKSDSPIQVEIDNDDIWYNIRQI
jgi:hypothetical protein